MENPAHELHELFSTWSAALEGNANSTANARGLEEVAGLDMQRRAMALFLESVDKLDDLEAVGVKVGVYRRYIPAWTRMLMSYPLPWYQQVNQADAFPSAAMDQLEALGGWFDIYRPRLRPGAEETLQAIVSDTETLLRDDSSLSNELKLYLARLLREIQAALDDAILGSSFDYAAATERLWVALFAAAAQSDSTEKSSKWTDLAHRFAIPTTVGLLTSLPGAAATLGAAAIGS